MSSCHVCLQFLFMKFFFWIRITYSSQILFRTVYGHFATQEREENPIMVSSLLLVYITNSQGTDETLSFFETLL